MLLSEIYDKIFKFIIFLLSSLEILNFEDFV